MSDNCCNTNDKKGIISGLVYGLIPHAFCIGFIIFSVVGMAGATALFKEFLVVPYFFQLLVAFSFLMATLSAIIYLKKKNCLCKEGVKSKWKYLTVLYGTTISINLLMFLVIFPAAVNAGPNRTSINGQMASASLRVEIPCSGHAPLIADELKKDSGIKNVRFKLPDTFEIDYDANQTSPENITSLEIFEIFKATIQ